MNKILFPNCILKVIISELFRESKQSTLLVVLVGWFFVCFNTLIAGKKKKKELVQ